MNDLISRQAAIDELFHVDENNGLSIVAIRNLPSAQPEIIRCKDCKYWERKSICDGYCDEMSIYGCDEDFYCGYAERKTDG